MYVSQIIESALTGIVDGNIWPLSCPLEAPPNNTATLILDIMFRSLLTDACTQWAHLAHGTGYLLFIVPHFGGKSKRGN